MNPNWPENSAHRGRVCSDKYMSTFRLLCHSGKGLGYMKWMDYCFVANIPINYSLFFSTLLKFKVLTFSHIHSLWRDTPTPTHQPVAFRRTAGSNVNPATPGCLSFKCLVVLLTSLGNNFGQPTWKNLDKSADHHRADE